jgi:predicted metal-dependent HD superfamily phosphohydrolase
MNPDRWLSLVRKMGLPNSLAMLDRLMAAYSEPHRHYHTTAHIEACLLEFDSVQSLAESPAEVELALWFHDVVYVPRASDNERRSADVASKFLASAGATPLVCSRVHSLVMATVHGPESPTDPDARLVVDIDLSILGRDTETYDRFEHAIREEYKWVPWFLYRRKRGEILQSFLNREFIYSTEPFRRRYELLARANLERAIGALAK